MASGSTPSDSFGFGDFEEPTSEAACGGFGDFGSASAADNAFGDFGSAGVADDAFGAFGTPAADGFGSFADDPAAPSSGDPDGASLPSGPSPDAPGKPKLSKEEKAARKAAKAAKAAAEEAARLEYEEQRQARLQKLERQQELQRQQQQSQGSSSWAGWLASPSMDLGSLGALQQSAEKFRKEAARRAEEAAAALQLQSPSRTIDDLSKALQGAGMPSMASSMASSVAALATPLRPAATAGEDEGSTGGHVGPEDCTAEAASEGAAGAAVDATPPPPPTSTSSHLMASMAGSLLRMPNMAIPTLPPLSAAGWSVLSGGNGSGAGAHSAGLGSDGGAAGAAATSTEADGAPMPAEPSKPLTESEQFEAWMAGGEYERAAHWAANSPLQELRTLATVRRFQAAPPKEGATQPAVLVYFGHLLRRSGPLTTEEGLELARGVCSQGQGALLERWLGDGKIERSVAVADVMREYDPASAAPLYRTLNRLDLVIQCHAELCDIDEVPRPRPAPTRAAGVRSRPARRCSPTRAACVPLVSHACLSCRMRASRPAPRGPAARADCMRSRAPTPSTPAPREPGRGAMQRPLAASTARLGGAARRDRQRSRRGGQSGKARRGAPRAAAAAAAAR